MENGYFSKGVTLETSTGAPYEIYYNDKVGWCLSGEHIMFKESTLLEILVVIEQVNSVGESYFDMYLEDKDNDKL